MKPNYYEILSRAVEQGVGFGLNRAYKHTPTPDPENVKESIHDEVMSAICEVFSFDDLPVNSLLP